uniref:ELM2 domain-containing protein n=1 Tax=Ascaris lumbricoides TaxID=6252 RepID=A0A0M3IRL5_ASCLU
MGVGVLRNVGGGLDYSELMKRHNVGDTARLNLPDVTQPVPSKDSSELSGWSPVTCLDTLPSAGVVKTPDDRRTTNYGDGNEQRSTMAEVKELKHVVSSGSSLVNCPLEIFEDDEKEEKGEAKDSEDGDEYEDEECSDVNEQTRLTEETENIEQRKAESKQPIVTINAQNVHIFRENMFFLLQQ